eukprot:2235980-Rhodomonas_salina.1
MDQLYQNLKYTVFFCSTIARSAVGEMAFHQRWQFELLLKRQELIRYNGFLSGIDHFSSLRTL